MCSLIYHPIYLFYENDFQKLNDIVIIKYSKIPDSVVKFQDIWLNWIRSVDIDVSVKMKNWERYELYDRISFTSIDRQNYYLFKGYKPLKIVDGEHYFNLLPLEFMVDSLQYFYGLLGNRDIDFRINVVINFENIGNLFLYDRLDGKIDFEVDFEELDGSKIWERYGYNWYKNKFK